jgi:hypothetical protein
VNQPLDVVEIKFVYIEDSRQRAIESPEGLNEKLVVRVLI